MSDLRYRPGHFGDLFKTEFGQRLWDFLNEPDNIIRMETATYLGRPAVEPLSPLVRDRFADCQITDRSKQLLGHMVRQVMEDRGYSLDRTGVRINRSGNLFTSGARYDIRAEAKPKLRRGNANVKVG